MNLILWQQNQPIKMKFIFSQIMLIIYNLNKVDICITFPSLVWIWDSLGFSEDPLLFSLGLLVYLLI